MVSSDLRKYIFKPTKPWQCCVYDLPNRYQGRWPERYEVAIPLPLIDEGDLELIHEPRDGFRDYVRAKSKKRVEVGVWDKWNDKPGDDPSCLKLVEKLQILHARNLPNDYVFVDRPIIVTAKLFDYSFLVDPDRDWSTARGCRRHCLILEKVEVIL